MRPASPSLSVIVPTLNEAENIEAIIAKILAGGASLDLEIIVVDDGSRDDTQAIVRRLAETLPVTLLAREKPKDGLAGAVLAGAREAKAGVVLVIDADGSHPPEKIPELALPVIRGERDMVIGSRYAPGGSTPGWSRKRRLMSRAASACAWPLTDVHDALSGFFAVRRELLAEIPSDAAGFKIALEILVRGGDSLRAGEVPIAFRDRELGQSKMGTGVILTYFRRLLALSGWRESRDGVRAAITKTLTVWAVDFALFAAACWLGAGLSAANLLGFAAGASLNAWLKAAQLPRDLERVAPLLPRLLFVSLLSLFLRSGVVATCAQAAGWPRLAAIIPAIITGWTVLFLGYALFIWPVREQYGSGVRWRVAAIGATAYLLALRSAYLYAIPIGFRLAALPHTADRLPLGVRLTIGLSHLGTMLLGPYRAGFNLPALLCWSIAAWAVFKATQRLFDKTTAFRALLLFSALPAFFWPGSIFDPATVLLAGWASALWLMTFALRWNWRLAALICGLALGLFWSPGIWLPVYEMRGDTPPALLRLVDFVALQAALISPPGLIAVGRYLSRLSGAGRRAGYGAAAICAAVAAVNVFGQWMDGMLGIAASGAIWLPLLPFIAAQMQRPGSPPDRWWGPTIYACIVCYGLYFYWLAFPGSV
jgi:dolichol-phosphate mannosyltransferase